MMLHKNLGISIVILVLMTGITWAGTMNYPIGLTYANGFRDLVTHFENNMRAEGYTGVNSNALPLGVQFNPFYQYDNGIRFGGSVGPIMGIIGDRQYAEIPLGIHVGYTFLQDSNIAPYIRAGLSYHPAFGDYVDGSNLGPLVGVGCEFLRDKRMAMGFEFAYDGASVDIEDQTYGGTKEFKTSEFMAMFYVLLR